MSVRVLYGGAWYVCPNGSLRVKDGGSWRVANFCYVRINGAWYDSGYRGYPNIPGTIGVSGWNFSVVNLYWSAPAAGGAPVDHYHLVQTDASGNWINQWNAYGTSLDGIGVSQDQRTRFYVRSVSASGLVSDWARDPWGNYGVGAQIGHTETGYTQSESYTQGWQSGVYNVNLYREQVAIIQVPGNVQITPGIYVNLQSDANWTNLSPGSQSTRNIHWVRYNVIQWGEILTLADPSHGWLYLNCNGGDNWFGLYANGAGYTYSPTGLERSYGNMEIHGIQTLWHDVYYKTRDYVGNSYW